MEIKICDSGIDCKQKIIANNLDNSALGFRKLKLTINYIGNVIENNNTQGLKGVIENIGSLFVKLEDALGYDMISDAVRAGKREALEVLLQEGHFDPNYRIDPDDINSKTPIRKYAFPDNTNPLHYAEGKISEARAKHDPETLES